jgi:hypothetical protein
MVGRLPARNKESAAWETSDCVTPRAGGAKVGSGYVLDNTCIHATYYTLHRPATASQARELDSPSGISVADSTDARAVRPEGEYDASRQLASYKDADAVRRASIGFARSNGRRR